MRKISVWHSDIYQFISRLLIVALIGSISISTTPSIGKSDTNNNTNHCGSMDLASWRYINSGHWNEAIQKLDQICQSDTEASDNEAWLAFAYLFQGKQKELKELGNKVKQMSVSTSDPLAAKMVEIYVLISQGKLDDAEKIMYASPSTVGDTFDAESDVLCLFTQACLALKKGDADKAAKYCQSAVNLCPDFAWGYRTLGFIFEKSLKNTDSAEQAYQKALLISPQFREVRDLLINLKLYRNDFDGAIALVNTTIKKSPNDSNNYYQLAQIYIQQWRLVEALQELEKAIKLTNNDPRFYRSKATIFRYQGKLDQAIAAQEKAVELSKDKSFELVELSILYELSGQPENAITALQKAVHADNTNQVAHSRLVELLKREKRYEDLVVEYKQNIEAQPKLAALRIGLAEVLKQTGKLNEALDQLKEAASLDPRDPRPHRITGEIELAKQDFVSAAKAYTRALNINPSSVDDLVALGHCYADNYDYMSAETAFVTALALQQLGQASGGNSGTVNAYDIMRSLAKVLVKEERYRDAAINLDAVVPADKDPAQKRQDQFVLSLCKALQDRTNDSVTNLLKSFDDLQKDEQKTHLPALVSVLLRLGKISDAAQVISKTSVKELVQSQPLILAKLYEQQDKLKEAEALANDVASGNKDNTELQVSAYLVLGDILVKEKDLNKALDAYKQASKLNPKSFVATLSQGKVYFQEKDWTKASSAAQQALEINPYYVPAYLLSGDAYFAQNQLKDAQSAYLKAAELYPTLPDVHKKLYALYQKQADINNSQKEQEIIKNLEKESHIH